MQKPPLDPDVADTAPSDSVLTVYDEEHVITYLRLLDSDAQGADWREVARVVLRLDPGDRARKAFEPFIARQKDDEAWLSAAATWWRVLRGVQSLEAPCPPIVRSSACAQDHQHSVAMRRRQETRTIAHAKLARTRRPRWARVRCYHG
jgi:hypothetical protein